VVIVKAPGPQAPLISVTPGSNSYSIPTGVATFNVTGELIIGK